MIDERKDFEVVPDTVPVPDAREERSASDAPLSNKERERAELIQGLRELATFLETHPEVPTPVYTALNVFVKTREDLSAVARVGSWQKKSNDQFFWLSRAFAGDPQFPALTLDINVDRQQVCRRVVTGTKVVPAEPERIVEEVEWCAMNRCSLRWRRE